MNEEEKRVNNAFEIGLAIGRCEGLKKGIIIMVITLLAASVMSLGLLALHG